LQEIRCQELLLKYAQDLSTSYAAALGCADVAFAYLRIRNEQERWTHVADVNVCLWEGEHLLSLLCSLARCGKKLHTQVLNELHKSQLEMFLLDLVPACLLTISRMNELIVAGKRGRAGSKYQRSAKAFLILHKILLMIPLPFRTNVLRVFLQERMAFHFYFDYIIPSNSDPSLATRFRKFLEDFPSVPALVHFVTSIDSIPPEFMHKYLMYLNVSCWPLSRSLLFLTTMLVCLQYQWQE
jgi:hypothetical protein